ncbi:MAG: MazG nucleotide pyrophosphohydrolase domain-containing protein [Promethearchaeota archaeon]|jgi:NTP pyrophosphatase (non-canonical NTP hydrolase)
MDQENSLKEVQKLVDNWIRDHGGYWSPLAMISAIIEELGEVAKEINSLEGYKPKKDNGFEVHLGEELADLIFSIVCLANHYQINLGKEFDNILKKYTKRDSKRFL